MLRLVGCENLISQRKEFIFNAFVYFQPVYRFQNRSDMRRLLRSGDSTTVLDVLEFCYLRLWKIIQCLIKTSPTFLVVTRESIIVFS